MLLPLYNHNMSHSTYCQGNSKHFFILKNRFKVSVFPRDCYFDYLDVEKFIKEEIEGKSLTIEGACKKLYDYLKKDVEDIQVESHVNDATHFPVKVLVD